MDALQKEVTLDSVKAAILRALSNEADSRGRVPAMGLSFGFWFGAQMDAASSDFLGDVAAKQGDEFVNTWLHGVLLESGFYEDAGDGCVQAKAFWRYEAP